MVCRDERGKGSTRWQKDKINLATPLWSRRSAACQRWPQAECRCTPMDIYRQVLSLPCQLSSYRRRHSLFPRPAGRRGMREGRRGCCQDAGAEGFWQMLLELPRNDCLTVPTPSRGRLVVTDSCGQICHKLPWYFPVRVLYRQQLIDSCWAIKTLDRVGRETETRICC